MIDMRTARLGDPPRTPARPCRRGSTSSSHRRRTSTSTHGTTSGDAAAFASLDLLAEQWQRILRPNGSLYVFASPQMGSRVEVLLRERFNILNGSRGARTHWRSLGIVPASSAASSPSSSWRSTHGPSAWGSLRRALRRCPRRLARSGLFRAYRWRSASGSLRARVPAAFRLDRPPRRGWRATGSRAPDCAYTWLRDLFGATRYEDLRGEYEELRREYEDLRRPFNVSADVPYTDVWDKYPTVMRRGKHPCEKPEAMMTDIIRASSRPGAVGPRLLHGTRRPRRGRGQARLRPVHRHGGGRRPLSAHASQRHPGRVGRVRRDAAL